MSTTDHKCDGCGIVLAGYTPADPLLCGACVKARDGRDLFSRLFSSELAAFHAAMDRKEHELDTFGYGGDPRKPVAMTGLASPSSLEPGEIDRLRVEAMAAWDQLRADVDALKAALGKPTFYVRPAPSSPPREDYVRVTVTALGYTFEPAVEYRDGDQFWRIASKLRARAHHVADFLTKTATEEVYADFEARPVTAARIADRQPDSMVAARKVAGLIAEAWPDRAYFVEVWQEGREGFAQVFQPFGVPRNR